MHLGNLLIFAAIGNPVPNRAWAIFLGAFLAAVAIGLLILSWTRWGQSKLLSKCIAIALLAHIWLLLYAYGTRIPYGAQGSGQGPGNAPSIHEPPAGPVMVAWTPTEAVPDPPSLQADPSQSAEPSEFQAMGESALWNRSVELPADSIPQLHSFDNDIPEPPSDELLTLLAQTDNIQTELEKPVELPIDASLQADDNNSMESSAPIVPIEVPSKQPARSLANVPEVYRLRFAPDRLALAMQNGGDASTEAAVAMALEFLSKSQSPDGSWSAQGFGAGRVSVSPASDAVYRADTGKFADTAMTGLALLAFLGAGHTHTDSGPYASTLKRGIDYLCQQQFPSGDLSGQGQIGNQPTVRYSRMYSHGIAGIALAESYAMTQDPKLIDPIRSAVGYTLKAMNPKTGGWRYDFSSDDPGDTSQFGWQAMLLSSANTSRACVLEGSRRVLLQRFLDSVSTGSAGGLAVYRNLTPLSRPSVQQATAPMTAEALAMRSMLGLPMSAQAIQEAHQLLLSQLPGSGENNFYYWYYGTLALHQTGSNRNVWNRWNEAMKKELTGTQVPSGEFAGSWDPRCVWGGHGGRIYTTALGCMCLEVYYRYLPLYQP